MAPRWIREDQKKYSLWDEGGVWGSPTAENPSAGRVSDRALEQGAKEAHLFPRHPFISDQDSAYSSLLILKIGKDS